jgi:hypothetical protein
MNLITQDTCLTSDYRTIPLTQGKIALVDVADYEFLMQWKWCAHKDRRTWYAVRNSRFGGKRSTVRMHHVVAERSGIAKGVLVDHADRDGLHNWRTNIRPASYSQNSHNRRLRSDNTSGLIGVRQKSNKYVAQIGEGNKKRHLGYFDTPNLAAKAYNKEAIALYGEFARLNPILEEV